MRDDRRRLAVLRAESEVFRAQLLGARHDDRAQPRECNHRVEPRRHLRQEHDNPVAFCDAEFAQCSGITPRRVGDLGKRYLVVRSRGVDEEQPKPRLGTQRIDDIAPEIEVGGDVPVK